MPTPEQLARVRIRNSGTLQQQAQARGEPGSNRFKPYRRGRNPQWLIGNGIPVSSILTGDPQSTRYRRERERLFAEGISEQEADSLLLADSQATIAQATQDVVDQGLEPTEERVTSVTTGRIVNTTGEDPLANPAFRSALVNNDPVSAGRALGDETLVVQAAQPAPPPAQVADAIDTPQPRPGFAANPNFDSSNVAGFTRSTPPPAPTTPPAPTPQATPPTGQPSARTAPDIIASITPEETAAVAQATVQAPTQVTAAVQQSDVELTDQEQRAAYENALQGTFSANQVDLTGEIDSIRQQQDADIELARNRSLQDQQFSQAQLARQAIDRVDSADQAFANINRIGQGGPISTGVDLASFRGINDGASLVTPSQVKAVINQQRRTADLLDSHRDLLSPAGQAALEWSARTQAAEDLNAQLRLQGRTDTYSAEDTLNADVRTQGQLESLDRLNLLATPQRTINELNTGEQLIDQTQIIDTRLQSTRDALAASRHYLDSINDAIAPQLLQNFAETRDRREGN